MKTKSAPTGSLSSAARDPAGALEGQSAKPADSSEPAPVIKKILVPIDFSAPSARALDYAFRLATEFAAKIILLHVVEASTYSHDFLTLEAGPDEAHQTLLESERYRLCEFLGKRTSQRPAVELLVRMGHAGSEIPDTAKALGADLIVLGAQGQSPINSALLGSTAERVLRHAHCPVLTVRHPAR